MESMTYLYLCTKAPIRPFFDVVTLYISNG